VKLSPTDCGFTVPEGCVCDDQTDIGSITIRIRRRGTEQFTLEYPAWDRNEDQDIVFLLDDLFLNEPEGRYDVAVFVDEELCGWLEIEKPKCKIALGKPKPIVRETLCFPVYEGNGCSLFEDVQAFKATLCGVLEKGVRSIPLCEEDKDTLCGLSLCSPVELVLSDGCNTEIVSFGKCEEGEPIFERGVAGTKQARFPVVSTLRFEWTEKNVGYAMVDGFNDEPNVGLLQCE